ncbi:MAG: hypothetical protein ABT20_15750 [Rubrivivax sp. SCN 70-15]|nr:MAG: hypothetical protein ABT20_15750 [Rubrivivax sp. SCN 70-15]
MTRPARTLLVFGIYLACVGLALMFVPNVVLRLFAMPVTQEVWIRIVGMLALYLAVYDLAAARGNWAGFIALSIPLRLVVIVFFGLFVLLASAPPMLLLFALPDFAFALWTWVALRQAPEPSGR